MTKEQLEQEIKDINAEIERFSTVILDAKNQISWLKKRLKLAEEQLESLKK